MRTNRKLSVLALASVLAACGGQPTGETNALDTDNHVTAAEPPRPVAFGRMGWVDGAEVVLTSAKEDDSLGMQAGVTRPPADETYLVVRYKMKNVSGRTIDGDERPTVVLTDPTGEPYSSDIMASVIAMRPDDDGSADAINPNIEARSVLAWRIKKGAFDPKEWTIEVGSDDPVAFAFQ